MQFALVMAVDEAKACRSRVEIVIVSRSGEQEGCWNKVITTMVIRPLDDLT